MTYLFQVHPILLLVLVPVWAFFLRLLAGLFQADIPSWPRAIVNIVLTACLGFLAYDASGYAFFRMFGTDHVEVPQGYDYGDWLFEAPALKWEVLGLVPGIRWLPPVFALCAGGTLQVLMLLIPFRLAALLAVVNWGANLALLALVGFLQTLVLGEQGTTWGFTSPEQSELRLKATPGFDPETFKGILANLTPKIDLDPKTKDVPKDAPKTADLAKAPPKKEPVKADRPVAEDVQGVLREFDPYLDSIRQSSAPFVQRFPALEGFLNGGGWWLILAALAALSIAWLATMGIRLRRLTARLFPR